MMFRRKSSHELCCQKGPFKSQGFLSNSITYICQDSIGHWNRIFFSTKTLLVGPNIERCPMLGVKAHNPQKKKKNNNSCAKVKNLCNHPLLKESLKILWTPH
jgi:hypothetical protein